MRLLKIVSLSLAAASMAAALALTACGVSYDGPESLIIGTEAAFPPFESVTADGSLEGFDIDLLRAVGEHLGRPIEFRNMEFSALLPELDAGRIDAIASGMTITAEREQVVDFTRAYIRTSTGVLASTTADGPITDAANLNDPRIVIAAQRKTTGAEKAGELYPLAKVALYDREVDAAAEVAAGRAHALVYDMVSIVKLHAVNPDTTRILDADLGVEEYGIALPTNSPLKAAIDAFLDAESKPGGRVDELLIRWLGDADRFRVEQE